MLRLMDETERQEIVQIREEIAALEQRLAFLYARREVKILKHAGSLTNRQQAELWGISNPRVNNIRHRDRLRAARR